MKVIHYCLLPNCKVCKRLGGKPQAGANRPLCTANPCPQCEQKTGSHAVAQWPADGRSFWQRLRAWGKGERYG